MDATLHAPPSTRGVLLGGLLSLRRRDRGAAILPAGTLRLRTRLDETRIAAYAAACGFTPAQGVPPTFPYVAGFGLQMAAMLDPGFPYPLVGLLHLANRIRQHAPLRAGQAVELSVRFGDALRHDRGQAFSLLTAMAADGRALWESESTYLRPGVAVPSGAPVPPAPDGPQPLALAARWRQDTAQARRYAALSGDRNPIHLSRLAARLFGFRRPIAHGMHVLARSVAVLLPQAPVAEAEIEAAFRSPMLLPGDALLLGTESAGATNFELRDGRAERLHLRGRLRATTA